MYNTCKYCTYYYITYFIHAILHMINSNKNLIPKKKKKLLIESKPQYVCISKFFNRKSSIVF